MKKITILGFLLFSVVLTAAPRPEYLPPCPSVKIKIEDYTPLDVLGLYSTDDFPEGHPFKEHAGNKFVSFKKKWKGANKEKTAEILFQFLTEKDNHRLTENVLGVINKMTNLSDTQKINAFVKVYKNTNSAVKKNNLFEAGYYLFQMAPELKIIDLYKLALSDSTVVENLYMAEGRPKYKFTLRYKAKRSLNILFEDMFGSEVFNRSNFYTRNEEDDIHALLKWMDENADLIKQKCAALLAGENRELKHIGHSTWDYGE